MASNKKVEEKRPPILQSTKLTWKLLPVKLNFKGGLWSSTFWFETTKELLSPLVLTSLCPPHRTHRALNQWERSKVEARPMRAKSGPGSQSAAAASWPPQSSPAQSRLPACISAPSGSGEVRQTSIRSFDFSGLMRTVSAWASLTPG